MPKKDQRSRRLNCAVLLLSIVVPFAVIVYGAPASPVPQGSGSASGTVHKTFKVGAGEWVDTGIDVVPGSNLSVEATGTMHDVKGRALTPAGLARGWADLTRAYYANNAGLGALVGRISSDEASVPFVLGASKQVQVNYGGRLYLAINDVMSGSGQAQITDTTAKYSVDVTVTGAALAAGTSVNSQSATSSTTSTATESLTAHATTTSATTATNPITATVSASALDSKLATQVAQLLSTMPRRVTDATGGIGDMVNFIIIGPQQKMTEAMDAAGWVIVDRDKKAATVHALLSTLEKKTYTEMPMSELYLFGRPQDYGYARAEPIAVATSRNHLRMWKTDQTLNGQTVWIGAATHDIGLERDQRNNGITHKIDPDIDKEREFLDSSLMDTGRVAGVTHILPSNPVQTAKTATGGSFFSDGRVLVLLLR